MARLLLVSPLRNRELNIWHEYVSLTTTRTAPKAKKRKTEPVEEVDDEEEVEGEVDDDEVEGKDLEEDEEDAGEEDADEDVSSRISIHPILGTRR
jgi:hypothetical protein